MRTAPKFREAADQLATMKKKGEIPMAVKFAKMNDGDEYNHAGARKEMKREWWRGLVSIMKRSFALLVPIQAEPLLEQSVFSPASRVCNLPCLTGFVHLHHHHHHI